MMTNKNKHMDLDDKQTIQLMLDQSQSFKSISKSLGKYCTTISKEVFSHRIPNNAKKVYFPQARCKNHSSCTIENIYSLRL